MRIERFPRQPQRRWLLATLCFGVCAVILFFAALQWQWPGAWWKGGAPIARSGDSLVLEKGRGVAAEGRLVIDGLAGSEVALATLATPSIRADAYTTVRWSIAGGGPGARLEFLWRSSESPGRAFARQIEWAAGGAAPLSMAGDANWRGEITGMALMVHPPLAASLRIEGVRLESFTPLRAVWREWFGTEQWLGTSINFVGGNEGRQWLAPLPFVAAVLGLAMLVYGLVAWRRRLGLDRAVFGLLFVVAWIALDLRWQIDLWHKLGLTQERYAGKTWQEKHLAAEDGRLFELMLQVRAKLPTAASRVYLFADEEYIRGRGAYHLYPFNVRNARDLPPAAQFHPGDCIVILGKDEVGYDPATTLLTWAPNQSLKADLLLLAEGNVLLRVK